jgi:hypothetical protein
MAIYLYCWAMEPGNPHAFKDLLPELTAKERPVYFDRLNAREPLGATPKTPEAARAELLALIAQEEERLEAVLAVHLEREDAEAEAEQAFDDTAYAERLRRYEAFNDRLLLRMVEALRKRHQVADGTAAPGGRTRRDPRPIAADPCPASPGEPASSEAGVAAPPEIESQAGPAPEQVESVPGEAAAVPAGSPPPATAGDDEGEAGVPTEEDLPFPAARILEVMLGCGPEAPPEEANGPVPSEVPGPAPDGTEPRPVGDPIGASAVLNDGASEGPRLSDRGPRPAPNGPDGPVPSARRLVGTVLALFAPILVAGLPAASARSSVAPTAVSSGGPIGLILARGSSHGPTGAGWLCSSRAPHDPVIVSRGGLKGSVPQGRAGDVSPLSGEPWTSMTGG